MYAVSASERASERTDELRMTAGKREREREREKEKSSIGKKKRNNTHVDR